MANLTTLFRLFLLFVVIAIIEYCSPSWQLLAAPLSIIMMLLDIVDGAIARIRHETSLFGAVFDIATDRIIEISMWVVLLNSNLIPIWIPITFITRGILIDSLRKRHSDIGKTPFGIMQTTWGRFFVCSRTMRFLYNMFKLFSFAWFLFLIPATVLWKDIYIANLAPITIISNVLIYTTLTICLIRGIPVILEAII